MVLQVLLGIEIVQVYVFGQFQIVVVYVYCFDVEGVELGKEVFVVGIGIGQDVVVVVGIGVVVVDVVDVCVDVIGEMVLQLQGIGCGGCGSGLLSQNGEGVVGQCEYGEYVFYDGQWSGGKWYCSGQWVVVVFVYENGLLCRQVMVVMGNYCWVQVVWYGLVYQDCCRVGQLVQFFVLLLQSVV